MLQRRNLEQYGQEMEEDDEVDSASDVGTRCIRRRDRGRESEQLPRTFDPRARAPCGTSQASRSGSSWTLRCHRPDRRCSSHVVAGSVQQRRVICSFLVASLPIDRAIWPIVQKCCTHSQHLLLAPSPDRVVDKTRRLAA